MGAKNKPPERPAIVDEHELVRIHMEATRQRDELQEEAAALRRAGKIREAKKVEARAAVLSKEIARVEEARRPVRP